MSHPSRFLTACLIASALPAAAQVVGTVSLPPTLAAPNAAVRWVQQVPAFCEGPAWDGEGGLYFTEQHGKDTSAWPLWKVDLRGASPAGAVVLSATGWANGLEFDPAGRLLACRRRSVGRLTPAMAFESLADSSATLPFAYANDLAAGSDGTIFFSALDSLLYRVGADGKSSVAARGHAAMNGVLWVEEAGALYASDSDSGIVWKFKVGPDGALSGRKEHLRMRRPDGMCMDEGGNLYVASVIEGRVRVFDPAGDSLGHVLLDPPAPWNGYKRGANGNASNCAFGGEDGRTLFITGDGGLYAVTMKVAGHARTSPAGLAGIPRAGPAGHPAGYRDILGREFLPHGADSRLQALPSGKAAGRLLYLGP